MRTLLCLASLAITTMAQAQVQPLPPPPRPGTPHVVEQPSAPSARGLFHVGAGFGFLTQRSSSSGYRQLDSVGYSTPGTSWHLNAGAQLVAADWLRVGAELSYEFAGDTNERRYRSTTRTNSTRFHMGIIDLSLTPYLSVGRTQLGFRLAGGFGFSRWVQNSQGSASGVYRASAAFDVYIPLNRQNANGLNLRFGYQLRRTLATGPLDLVFDQSSIFFNFAYMFGVSS